MPLRSRFEQPAAWSRIDVEPCRRGRPHLLLAGSVANWERFGGILQSGAPAARAVNVRPGRTALIQSCVLPPVNASGSSSPRAGTDVPAETGKAHVRL